MPAALTVLIARRCSWCPASAAMTAPFVVLLDLAEDLAHLVRGLFLDLIASALIAPRPR